MHRIHHLCPQGVLIAAICLCSGWSSLLAAQERQYQCFKLEFFYDSTDEVSVSQKAAFERYVEERPGLKPAFRDLHEDERSQKRLQELEDYFGLKERSLPAVYGLKYLVRGVETEAKLKQRLDEILTMTVYVRSGCPHCRDARAFLAKYGSRYPALNIVYREVVGNRAAANEMQAVVRRYRQRAASLPVIHYCNGLSIGFGTESTTGRKILQTLDYWSAACSIEQKKKN